MLHVHFLLLVREHQSFFDAGVEYVVSEKLFGTLPDEEKQLWHSHFHEVRVSLEHLHAFPSLRGIITAMGGLWCPTDQRGAVGEPRSARGCTATGAEATGENLREVLVHLAV